MKVKVKVDYDTGLNDGWTSVGQTEATGGTHTYTLDTDGIDTGSANKYIIVARNAAYLLDAGSAVAITVSSDGKTATTSSRDYEYYFTGRTNGLITRDGTNTLYQQNWGIHTGNISDSNLDMFVNNGNGYYRIYDGDGTQRSLYYDGSKWTVTNDNHTSSTYNVRLYKHTSTTGGTPAGNLYAHLEGADTYHVPNGITAAAAMNIVKTGITGKVSYSADGTDATVIPDADLQWSWKNRFNGNVDGSYWVEIKYNGITLGTVEVIVEPGVVNDYPEYPHEGAVKVSKTATGIDFQSSGIAQVEISASGVPSKKGADVVVMLDTSSSMTSWCICGTQDCKNSGSGHVRRSVVLEESLTDLIAAFQKNGPDGAPLDINVAIADFNGFYSSGAIARDSDDTMADTISYNATSEAKVYTGDKSLNYGAFIPAQNLDETYTLNYTSGTNYDYAFDAIYQLGEASRNSGLDRDLYVIFMSDGAAMQWNYYHSQGQSDTWGEWITGTYKENELAAAVDCDTHTYYYNLEDTNGDGRLNEHRMANAVKGDQTEAFEVIRKATGGIDNLTAVTGKNNIYTVPGLGATVFSIAFAPKADGKVEAHYMTTSIETLATKQEQTTTKYYYEVNSSDELSNAFSSIGSEIAYAAYNARFVDQMGSSFNLQMTPSEYTVIENGKEEDKTFYPDIQVLTYDIFQPADVGKTINGKTVTEDMIGQRTGEYNVEETVKFSYSVQQGTNAAGDTINVYTMTGAYSDKIDVDKDGTFGWDAKGNFDTADNILGNGDAGYVAGIVYAKTFLYNTTDKNASVTGVQIPTDSGMSNVLPSETFYWKLGTIQSDELAMRYYVYLDGSMEGTKAAGSYQTNEFATLYYDNYLGHACKKETVSPVIAWKSAKVSYAFYLVNEDGDIIVNQTTGETGTFANKIELTSPVVYEEILLNNLQNVSSLNVRAISKDVLPDYYTLYDDTAEYTVTVMSNTSGRWEIKSNSSKEQSTYVMDYNTEDPTDYSNKVKTINVQSNDYPGYEYVPGTDYTHTTVWFAVIWSIEAHPDTVVVDYGLPVDISVLSNDMFGDHGHLEAVGPYNEGIENTVAGKTLADGFLKSDDAPYTGNYGKANVDITTGKVHYVPGTMDWASEGPGYERFAYAVNYTPGEDGENAGYYYDTVTVIPATTVYYEDNFTDVDGSSYITYGKFDKNKNPVTPGWEVEGTAKTDATQAEDRPGYYHLSGVDANNVYGYDGAYTNMSKYSMGSAMKVHVDPSSYATAEFTFYGTGLDIISMTTNTSGVLNMWIKDANGNFVKDGNNNTTNYTVDTYYGYKPTYWAVTYTYNSESQSWREDVVEVSALGTSGTQPENPSNGATYTVYETRWVPTPEVASSLYQVPVLKAEGLPYGKYTVTLNAAHFEVYDHTTADGYDLYLDAIRIYDPAGTGQQVVDSSESKDDGTVTNVTIKDIYAQDNEGWPTYHELRNMIITAADFNAAQSGDQNTGIIFIDNTLDDPDDGKGVTYTISDYTSYGPNNELYLTTGQSVAFELDLSQYIVNGKNIVADVQIGIKSADSQSGTAYLKVHSAVTNLSKTVTTSTDMYYSIRDMLDLGTNNTGTEPNQDAKTTLVLQNNADQGIVSITNIKITLKEAPPAPVETASTFRWSPSTGEQAVRMLRAAAPVTPIEPETTVPETTVPETTVPEVTETETTVPEETEPETTVPEETEPEEETPSIQTQITQTVVKIVNTVKNILNSLFGRWM